jgi:hypothetical protein
MTSQPLSPGGAVKPTLPVEAARGLASGLLARDDASAIQLLNMAQLCRQAGALSEARGLLDKIAELEAPLPEAQILSDAFDGRAANRLGEQAVPTPFVLKINVFDLMFRDYLYGECLSLLPDFESSLVDGVPLSVIRENVKRKSLVLYDLGELGQRFMKRMKEILANEIYPIFGIEPGSVNIELQATCHGDEAFFTAHRDVDAENKNGRLISFVYYLHNRPRAFSGGDLILFDMRPEIERYSFDRYTRVAPEDNSLIIFPSTAVHEVQRVSLPNQRLQDGRLTINGWVRARR